MMKIISRICAVVLGLSMVLSVLAGCGKDNSADGVRTITFMTIKDYYTTAMEQIAKDYNQLHPETKVEIQIVGNNTQYSQNFTTKISADKSTAPDIIHTNNISGNSEGEMITKKWLLPLDDLLDEENPYNGGKKVREAFTDEFYLTQAIGTTGKVGYLPFDLVSVGCYYNKTIFNNLNLEVPETYEDFVRTMKKLQDAGYSSPLGATAFLDQISSTLIDWGYRYLEPDFLTLPGDALYDEKTMKDNLTMQYSPDNPMFDATAVLNQEKIISYVKKNGIDNPVTKKIWETTKSILQFCPTGWVNADDSLTYNQFLAQKTPLFFSGSWQVGKLMGDISKLSEDKQFEWGVMDFAKFETPDSNFQGNARGLLTPGHKLGIVDKDDEDLAARAADFLKYMYSPEVATKIYEITLEKGELVQGPSLIKGVSLDSEISDALNVFLTEGSKRLEMLPLAGIAKTADKPIVSTLKQDYVAGKINYDEFIKEMQKLTDAWVEDKQNTQGFDLDPTTPDEATK